MSALPLALAQVALLLLLPPLLLGVIGRVKARFAGRTGPPLLQPYRDLAKLLRKSTVTSRTTTWVFPAGPAVALVTALAAGLLLPFGGAPAPLHFAGDAVLFAYLFALGRFFTASAALDTGSAFEGMGAARDVTFAVFAEPALFLSLLGLSRISGGLSLSTMVAGLPATGYGGAGAGLVLLVAALFVVLLAETARLPVDDPATHLELTMVHEVMLLDHSGPPLSVALYGAAVKLLVLGMLVVRVLVPVATSSPWLDLALFAGLCVALAAVIGVVESTMARLRLVHVPNLLIAATLLSGFGFVLLVTLP